MSKLINNVLVVGGGTAGWLTAAILAKHLNSKNADAVQVTLVESPDIPIIGVGEGTWPTIRTTLQTIGIDEGEFMRECDAAFKQGSEFVNWYETPKCDEKHSYYHPLSAVFHSANEFGLAPYWLLKKNAENLPAYDLSVATQTSICKLGLGPKKITTPAYVAIQNYSYHLNAEKFASYIGKFSVKNLGVKHIFANVTDVNVNELGNIESVLTDNAGFSELKADFFIDCTGMRALLIGKALGIGWKNINDIIFNDTALAMQVPYENKDDPIATHTIGTAQEAGWIWDIGLHNRRGTGYVYSSKYTNDTRAEEVLRKYAGKMSEGLEVRKIKLNLGYREKFWHKNCVAVGMSAAFIEPLEASAIFLVEAAAKMIADQFPRDADAMPYVEKKFNETFHLRWSKSVDFVKLHYCISKRRDTQYWIDNCDPKSIPETLQEKLNHWRSHPPSKHDFNYVYEPFVLESYLFVLYGMHFNTKLEHNASAFQEHEMANKMFAEINKLTGVLAKELPTHRDLLEKVYKYGLQKM